MIMKWEDLEPGDIICATQSFGEAFPSQLWTNKNLKINKIHVTNYYTKQCIQINTQCDDEFYYFEINGNGECLYHEYLGQAFDIVELRE